MTSNLDIYRSAKALIDQHGEFEAELHAAQRADELLEAGDMDGRRDVCSDLRFFRLWLRRPLGLGAVVPSGRALATAMAACIDARAPGMVVELGGGTGNITRAIRKAGVAPGDLIVVEREAALCEVIGSRFPDVRIWRADASELEVLVDRAGALPVKTIVSSLPFLSMDDGDRRRILDAAFAVLAPDGEFLQFTYGPAPPVPQRTRDALRIVGARSERVFSNLPPAAVWRYRRKDRYEADIIRDSPGEVLQPG